MNIQDAIYNWLSIKVVLDDRPSDAAAQETYDFFDEILRDDHHVEKIDIQQDEIMYTVTYWIDGDEQQKRFPVELIDALMININAEPTFNE